MKIVHFAIQVIFFAFVIIHGIVYNLFYYK